MLELARAARTTRTTRAPAPSSAPARTVESTRPAAPVKKSTTQAPAARKKRTEAAPTAAPVAAAGSAATVVAYARAQIGKRYVWGATGPNAFDCSGLVVAAFARVGISLPHYTGTLSARGRAVSRSQLQPGDLIFPHAGHVGIYVGGNQMVHASTPKGGVKLSGFEFSYARRIL